jgi:alpha-tubulin suppressor-like RCC1 family protein
LYTGNCEGHQDCGNGGLDEGEECDGGQLDDQTCESLGYGNGILECRSDCRFDITGCDHSCGDGTCEPARGENSWTCSPDCAWTNVSAGRNHTCATRSDGTVWCWGGNHDEQLGIPNVLERHVPVKVPLAGRFVFVSAGGLEYAYSGRYSHYHTCALASDGSVFCWGENERGQLGVPLGGPDPVQTHIVSDVAVLSAGARTNCVVQGDGAAYCWGDNDDCQCGHPVPGHHSVPLRVMRTLILQTISVGETHACAVLADGTARCWGRGHGLGLDEEDPCPAVSMRMDLPGQATELGAGRHHTCALLADSRVWCWGRNDAGQIGNGTISDPNGHQFPQPPARTLGLTDVSMLTAGGRHNCALKTDRTVWCWGANWMGQLGDGTTELRSSPMQVPGLPPAIWVEAGWKHTCAIAEDGTLWCWGLNANSQLAIASETGPEHCEESSLVVPPCSTALIPVESID